ncbi:MAG TPA: hypothetical protein VGL89_09755 [Candidatus Koribacter sp.]|jgi:hypothetical protein
MRPSPFARGFRSTRREPSVSLAEIAWRWLFGGIATALFIWATLVFLRSVEVSKANQFLLRSLNPELISYALRTLFEGKGPVLIKLGLIVGVSLSFLWILTATIGRTATTRVLLERSATNYDERREVRSNFRAIAAIHFVRVALLWVGLAAYFFAALIASRVTTTGEETHPGAFLMLFLAMFLVAAAILSFFNWVLLLAPIYALRDHLPFSDATLAAWCLTRDRAGSLIGLNLAHLAIRLVWFIFMSGVAFVPLGFLHVFPKFLVFGASIVLTLIYCAVADVLFVARYAAYIEIADQELHPSLIAEFPRSSPADEYAPKPPLLTPGT